MVVLTKWTIQRQFGEHLLYHIAKAQPDVLDKTSQLIHAGADLTVRDRKGESALSLASFHGLYDLCVLLLDAGSDVNTMNHSLVTPLHYAIKRRDKQLCTLLLDRGANVAVENRSRQTLLHLAVISKREDLVALILGRGPHLEARDQQNDTPLLLAAGLGRKDVCLQLVQAGADLSARNCRGHTVLHRAADRNDVELFRYLINLGAEVTMKDNNGTSFSELLERGEAEQEEEILKKQEKIEKKEGKRGERMEQQNTTEKAAAVGIRPQKRNVDTAGLADRAPREKKSSVENRGGGGVTHVDGEGAVPVVIDVDERLREAEAQADYMPERAESEARLAAESRLRKVAEEKLVVAQQTLEALGRERDREVNALNDRVAELLERATRAELAAN